MPSAARETTLSFPAWARSLWSEVRDSGALEVELLEVVGEDFVDVMDVVLK
jgi:hypothetical protein